MARVVYSNPEAVPALSPQEAETIRQATANLYKPSAAIYWCDFVGSAAVGWAAFATACIADSPFLVLPAFIVAWVLLYRAFLFIHELSHSARNIAGFETAWNVLAGFPLLAPSCLAVGIHWHHHALHTYGTERDPEYQPFAYSRATILRFIVLTLVFPLLMVSRFLVAAPLALLIPRLHRYLERHATSMAMNPKFERSVGRAESRIIKRSEICILVYWVLACPLAIHLGGWKVAGIWLAITIVISATNGIRTLASHRYLGGGGEFGRAGQMADSIETPGAWWTTVWAPVGHRYHALHHYAPALPYHNLGIASRRLVERLQKDSLYSQATSESLYVSLSQLWRNASQR